jgi:hypothetical protein
MRLSRRICLIPALAVILLGHAISPGAGQTRGDPAVQAAETVAPVPKNNQLESVLGREVRTRVEEDVGRIIDLLADRNGRVQAAVIEFGGFLGIGTRKIAVEWSALRFESDGKQAVIVEMTRDQLRVAPEYKPSEPAVVRRASE